MVWEPARGEREWLAAETDRLLAFGVASRDPRGGFGWLGVHGAREAERPVELWITCRMTHVYSLAQILGWPGASDLVSHGLAALTGALLDAENGGWFASIDASGPVDDGKHAYAHAFVILAASSAVAAGHDEARRLLDDALCVHAERFWDAGARMTRENFSADWSVEEQYRGVNAAMHTVEAYLAAHDVVGDSALLDRALAVIERVVHLEARAHAWLIPEHYTPQWAPLLYYNRDDPAHPFRPYGATIGHLFEWSRLTVQAEAALVAAGQPVPDWMLPAARALYDAAVAWGWHVDDAAGFVYTVDWDGAPVVRERMHWVAAEATAAAAVLAKRTSDAAYVGDFNAWWSFVRDFHVDLTGGSWWHELSPDNVPGGTVWLGKPDLYHAVQATLVPRMPVAPSIAWALAAGTLR